MFYYEILILGLTFIILAISGILNRCKKQAHQYEGGDRVKKDFKCNCSWLIKAKIWFSEKFIIWVQGKVIYGAVLRLFLEGYFEVCVATLPTINRLDFSNNYHMALSILAIIHLVIILIGFPIFVALFFYYFKNESDLGNPQCQEKYGSLYIELNYYDKRALAYHVLFLIRRFVLIMQATVLTRDHQFLNVFLLLLTSSCMMVFIVKVRPFEESLNNRLELFNEIIVLLVSVYHCIIFSDLAQSSDNPLEYQFQAGWTFIFLILAIQIPTNLLAIGINSLHNVWIRRKRIKAFTVSFGKKFRLFQNNSKINEVQPHPQVLPVLKLNNFLIRETERDLVEASKRRDDSILNFMEFNTRHSDRDITVRQNDLNPISSSNLSQNAGNEGQDMLTVENYNEQEDFKSLEEIQDSHRTQDNKDQETRRVIGNIQMNIQEAKIVQAQMTFEQYEIGSR